MALIDRTIKAFFQIPAINQAIRGRVTEAASRAYEAGFSDGNDDPVSGTIKSYGYRRITTGGPRDFTKMPYDKVIETVWSLFQSNPVAKQMLRLKINHYLGTGLEFQSDDEGVDEEIRKSWELNKLHGRRLRQFVFDLRLWGEQIYPAFVRKADGQTRLGYIDVGEVESVLTHPDNIMERWMVVLKEDNASDKRRVYRVIRQDEAYVREEDGIETVIPAKNEGLLVTHEQATNQDWEKRVLKSKYGLTEYTGSVLLFQANNVSNQSRGFSDLIQSLDWIDILDETLFAVGEREQLAAFFSWDVTLEGATEDQVKIRSKEAQSKPPNRGSARFHNEKESWDMKWPDLKQMGSIETVKATLAFILGGFGIPFHWFGFGDSTNRATALAQGDPTHKMMEQEQDEVRDMILEILTFFRDQAIIAGNLSKDKVDAVITIMMPAITKKDMASTTQSMAQLTQALVVAEEQGWSTPEQVVEVWQKVIQEFGVKPVDINEMIKERSDIEGAKDEARRQMLLLQMQNGNGQPDELIGGKAPEVDPKTVLNGAQVASALDIVVKVKQGVLSYEAGLNALQIFFNLTPEQARRILGRKGEKLPENGQVVNANT